MLCIYWPNKTRSRRWHDLKYQQRKSLIFECRNRYELPYKFTLWTCRDKYCKTDFAITQLIAIFWFIIWVCTCNFAISTWSSPIATYMAAANKHFWTQLAPQIMHQNLAIILWQFCYGKISFLVFVPGMWPNFTTLHKNFKNVFGNFVSV